MEQTHLSQISEILVSAFEHKETKGEQGNITVNQLVSQVATWYEKLRTAMDYREEEVILRASIERILKRRIILGGKGETIAEPLVRELVWARYFKEKSIPESIIREVAEVIDLYFLLRSRILAQHKISENTITEWTYHLVSSHIEKILHPDKEKDLIGNVMYQILRKNVTITDDSEQSKDAQVFIAIRRSFAKDDIAFLRYHLFSQYFGQLSKESIEQVASDFIEGYKEIQKQLNYPKKERIYSYIKKMTAVFFILEDLLRGYEGNIRQLVMDSDELKKAVFAACEARYSGISGKVRRAIIRSVIFILFTKAIFAFAVEGTVENIFYGGVSLSSILVNTLTPALLMVVVGFFIGPPGRANSEKILQYIRIILFEDNPRLGDPLSISLREEKRRPVLNAVFTILWFLAFIVSFGGLIYLLRYFNFHFVSQAVFLFFLTIVSFLAYRIGLTSKEYTVDERQAIISPITDFFFMPVVRVGRHLTEGIAQINIILFIFDFIIETPFKGIFSFLEQLFFFLHAKREELG